MTLYELGLEGMADQNEELEPTVTVVVAAASVAVRESSDAAVMVTFCPLLQCPPPPIWHAK